jgi:hypothetical protein
MIVNGLVARALSQDLQRPWSDLRVEALADSGLGSSGNIPAITLAVSTQIKRIDPVVFYDPNRPGRCCFVAGPDDTILAIAVIFSVVGVTALVAGIR